MTVYRWDSFERRFAPSDIEDDLPSGELVYMTGMQLARGERTAMGTASDEMLICMIRGAWRMQIAGSQLTVHNSEAVIIPYGFSHSAEALEDSYALQVVRQRDDAEDRLWAV